VDRKAVTTAERTLEYELAGSKVVVPRELRDGMLYLHHYSRTWRRMRRGWTWQTVFRRLVIPGEGLVTVASRDVQEMHVVHAGEKTTFEGSGFVELQALSSPLRHFVVGHARFGESG
jgi:hypothetical protein